MYPAQGACQRPKRLIEWGQPKYSKRMQHVSVCFISVYVSVLYQVQRAMHRRLREQQLQQLDIWDQSNLYAETDATSAWPQTLQPKASAYDPAQQGLIEQKTSVQHLNVTQETYCCFPRKYAELKPGELYWSWLDKMEEQWFVEALAPSNSFSFQAIFAIKDQFRISKCGLRSNIQSQKATTWVTAFTPQVRSMSRWMLFFFTSWQDVRSASTKNPRSPEGAPSGRAGASARSRIWRLETVKSLRTKDVRKRGK